MEELLLDKLIEELFAFLFHSAKGFLNKIKMHFKKIKLKKEVKVKFEEMFLKKYSNQVFYDELSSFLIDSNYLYISDNPCQASRQL